MSNINAYVIFEPDQVLTNDHLNEMFDYLDVQERLTRNKLIGIGIVCGLAIDKPGQTVSISKGCGVTSKGYLVVWNDAILTQYVEYTLPANPLYTPFINEGTGRQYPLLRMITDEEATKIESGKKPVGLVLKNKIAILFLEANEKNLKNCDTQDCNDKGRQMELTVRPLLIDKADMEAIIIKQKKLVGDDGLSNSYIERLGLKDIALQRFDVKASPLVDAYDIFDAYIACFDNETLAAIANSYSQCFSIFQPILKDYGNSNPFLKMEADLKAKLDYIRKSMPIYIQYYYDFLDDLVKAYKEFKEVSFEVITECCPDEDLFPMHLMLGEATVDTVDDVRSPFRQYFVSSPLYNNQSALLNEVKVLFDRMVSLTKSFFIPTFGSRSGVPIRITPSIWGNAPLSLRSIPYYYNINFVSKSWNALKTRKGQANQNLSYNADRHFPAAPEMVVNPLRYGVEQNDFYRIEGHIGQPYLSALNVILSTRNTNRLPFDVIALKAGTNAADTEIKYDCHFQDLEAQFGLLRAELACKMHEPLCIAAKVPALLRLTNTTIVTDFSFLNTLTFVHSLAVKDIISNQAKLITNFVQVNRFTTKGDFLKTYCPVTENTLGNEYIKSTNKFYPRPSKIDLTTTSGAKAALMHLIDITEALMQTITGASTIYNFRYTNFNRIYIGMISFFNDFMQAVLAADNEQKTLSPMMYGMLEAVVTGCMDEKIKALVDEYARRVEKIQKQNLLSQYLTANPGIDHKAGVPRGGTFILVYHDAPAATATAASNTLTALAGANTTATFATANTATIADTGSVTTKLAATSVISKNNLDKILSLFNTSTLQLSATQSESLRKLALQQFTTAVAKTPFNIPDNAVVADFYLPYLCCSDCPPVTYVLPKVPQDILMLSLEKTSFCNNDSKAYKVTVNPVGGTLTALGGGINSDTMEFVPKGIAAGINKITYTLPDNRSTSVDVTITAAFEINFDFSALPNAPLTYQFVANNIDKKSVVWNFGDGTATSTEQKPIHTFAITGDAQSFIVTLTATDGPCVAEAKQEVRIQRPKDQVFTIRPNVFCSNDKKAYAFIADPQVDDIDKIKNPDQLILEKANDGSVVFIPAKQTIEKNKKYTLQFNGASLEISVIAAFAVEFTATPIATSPLSRRFVATNIEGKEVRWNFGDGSAETKEPSPVHTYKISDNSQTFEVTLTVTDGPCSITTKKVVVIERPVQQVFTITPNTFCSNDRKQYIFTADPFIDNIADVENPDGLQLEQNANKQLFFVPAKQEIDQTKAFKLSYKGQTVQLSIIAISAAEFKIESVATSATSRLFTAVDVTGKNVEWNFGDGTPVSKEPSVVHNFKTTDNGQTFTVTLTVTDGPCRATATQQVVLQTDRITVFTLEPLQFCFKDEKQKFFNINPLPASPSEIKNADKLELDIDNQSKRLFFVPAKQPIKATKNYLVSYGNQNVQLTILLPEANFTMDIKRNTSPLAAFPTLLNLKAQQTDADSFFWRVTNQFGTILTFEGDSVNNFDLNRLRDPNRQFAPITIVLNVNYNKRTQTDCGDSRDYIITQDVLRNHLNKGEFNNLSNG